MFLRDHQRRALLLAAALVQLSCDGGAPSAVVMDAGVREAAAEVALDVRPERPAAMRTCAPPPGVSARPRTIAETVALINSLPRPVTVACFLESLERPLHVNATRSLISLQPAVGAKSPRLFLMFDGMSISVVPEGTGSKLIEFGEFVDEQRTIKAELKTPINTELEPASPYLSLKVTQGPNAGMATTCRTCHAAEERAEGIPFAEAFHSVALRPDPRTVVPLEDVLAQRDACPEEDQGERCAMLRALFDHGPVLPRAFPDSLRTIFQ